MTDDGRVDYTGYSRAELEEALGAIDRARFPKNLENLTRELASRGAGAAAQGAETTSAPERRMAVEEIIDRRLALGWRAAITIIWATQWRGALVGVIAVVVAGFAAGLITGLIRDLWPIASRVLVGVTIVAVVPLAAGYAYRWALNARYSAFEIVVHPLIAPTMAAENVCLVEPTLRLGTWFWWANTWRTLLFTVPIGMSLTYLLFGQLSHPDPFSLGGLAYLVAVSVLYVPIWRWALREALQLSYHGLQISLLQRRPAVLAGQRSDAGPGAA